MDSGISREKHIEMLELMGREINEDDLPISFDDLAMETRLAIEIHQYFGDQWTDSGVYIAKDLTALNTVFDAYEITDNHEKLYILKIMNIIDRHLSNKTAEKLKSSAKNAGRAN